MLKFTGKLTVEVLSAEALMETIILIERSMRSKTLYDVILCLIFGV
ncbi:hypothetical protein IFVP182_C1200020 [Vibrio parahaemolyticus]